MAESATTPPPSTPLLISRSLSMSALAARHVTQAPTLSPAKKKTKTGRCRCGATHTQYDTSLAAMMLCSVKRDDLLCSICFDILCFPVTLPCGHNFDRGCILAAWRYDAPADRQLQSQRAPQERVAAIPQLEYEREDAQGRRHTHSCPLCRQEAGISSVNELQVNLLLKDVITKLYPMETASAATLEKQLSAARIVALTSGSGGATLAPGGGGGGGGADTTRSRHSFRALSSFVYVCVASVTDPPGFVLAVLLLLALLAIACNPQHAVAGNASAATLTLVDVLDRVVNGFSVLIREFSLKLDQLQQLKPWIRAFSFVL